ncbi:hypothetical protein [Microbispora sp. NPDC049125]|uniref:hypothetical protein n=1 Tax=Microbispora sp. NPDC049125 TaxID=3154929 RepID=UPI0034650EE5
MGYPGDQQPHRQPHLPPDQPRQREAPPYGGGEGSPFGTRRDVPPYRGGDDASRGAWETPRGDGQEPPYGGEQSPYAGRRDASPYQPSGAAPWPGQGQGPVDDLPPGRRAARTAAPPPAEPPWDPYAPAPLWRRPIVLGAALLALIGALFLGLWVAARNEPAPVPTPTALPKASPIAPQAPEGKYGYAASRATDKVPLTVRELFGKKTVVNDKRSYARTVFRTEKKCSDGISGTNIGKALKTGGCTQLIRASFKDAKGTIIGTVGVANLKTSAAAKKVASAGGGGERKDFLKPLPGKDDATKQLGSGEAYAGGWTHGHYAVLLWFQFKDGHKPTKNELKRLYQAAVDVTDTTVFPALDVRSLTGGHG